jgi:hypothetical protein
LASPDDDRTLIDRLLGDSRAFPDPIPGIIPFGSICTLAGASGVGKTALYAGWIADWLDGRPICGHPTNRPVEIGIIVGDRRWQSHRQWLEVAGVAVRVKYYSLRDDDSFPWNELRLWPKVAELFTRALDKLNLAPGSLVIVDPLALWLAGRVNDYKDVAIGLGVLDRCLKPRQLTMIGVFHQSKQIADKSQQYARPQDKILGSAATIGFSDTAMYLLGPEDLGEPWYGFGWVPHNAKAETFEFVRNAWGLFIPYAGAKEQAEREAILMHVPYESLATQAIIRRIQEAGVQLSKATIERRLKDLLQQGHIIKVAHGIYSRVKPS